MAGKVRKKKGIGSDGLLNDNQLAFCQYYIQDFNATQAAIKAGYSAKTAKSIASTLLTKINIQAQVNKFVNERKVRTQIDSDTVLLELLKIAKSDIRRVLDDNCGIKKISDIDDDTAACISSIEVDEIQDFDRGDKVFIGFSKKVKLWDKMKALDLLGKHLRLFGDKVEVTHDYSKLTNNELDARIRELEESESKKIFK